MFDELEEINARPEPFEFYTAADLWTDEHTSKQMLAFHLNEEVDAASRSSAFINRSIEWISSHFNIGDDTKIADFGCGPGLYATGLAQKHAKVTGIDFSARSIQYALEAAADKGLSIDYINMDYLDFETDDRFHLILMIMCDFCAMSPAQRRKMLTKFYKLLEPDGSVLLDVYSLNAFEKRAEMAVYEADLLNGFWSPNKYYGFLNTFKYDAEKVALDKYTIVESDRTHTIYNWLQYYDIASLKREFLECGFTIGEIYSDVAGAPYNPEGNELAVIARRSVSTD